jgi:hypothetical protein
MTDEKPKIIPIESNETIRDFLNKNQDEFLKPYWHKGFETGFSRLDRLIMNIINSRQLQEIYRIEADECSKY